MLEKVVKFGNAEFHYKWLSEEAERLYADLEKQLEQIRGVYAFAVAMKRIDPAKAEREYLDATVIVRNEMARLVANFWFADKIFLKDPI